jgi:hypothetical protein
MPGVAFLRDDGGGWALEWKQLITLVAIIAGARKESGCAGGVAEATQQRDAEEAVSRAGTGFVAVLWVLSRPGTAITPC